jgi:hypothetical protein
MAVKKLLAIVAVASLPTALPAGDPPYAEADFGLASVLVIDESAPVDMVCAKAGADRAAQSNCMAVNRAVLTAHTQRVSWLREHGRWM